MYRFIAVLKLLCVDASVACTSGFGCFAFLEKIVPSPRGYAWRLSSQDKLLCLKVLWMLSC